MLTAAVSDDLASGRLIHVMPKYQSAPMELYAIFGPGKPGPPRIRLFVDHIARHSRALSQGSSANVSGAHPNPMAVQPG
jgi:DNA-binding transcriptional LysR family regulator